MGEWTGHLTFASDLIVALQPDLIVELGTHWGEAYFTFCQTVQEHGLGTLCYAVDHWLGDDHAGHYGEEVFEEVSQYNNRLYRQFSYLLRRSFDEALTQFADGSIDLLHIDGLHTYDAVNHDFRGWLPKIRPGGMVLLHDIAPRHQDFGVWRLWDEIKAEFPHTFEFHHSWGLGVVRRDGSDRKPLLLELLFESSPEVREDVRRHYVIYASHLEHILGRMPSLPAPRVEVPTEVRIEVFPWIEGRHSPEFCQVRTMPAGSWNTLVFDLRYPDMTAPLRVDTGYEPCLVEVGDVAIHSSETGQLLWKSPVSDAERGFQLGGTALVHPRNPSFFINMGDDPHFLLNTDADLHGPLTLTIDLKVLPAPKAVMDVVQQQFQAELANATNELSAAKQEKVTLQTDKETLEAERDKLAAGTGKLVAERDMLAAESSRLKTETEALRSRLTQVTSDNHQNVAEVNTLRKLVGDIQNSASWRITSPLRKLMVVVRGSKN